MARARKRHVQQDLPFKARGGKRKGAGRPPKGPRSSEPHKKRPYHHARHPVHVTTRVALGNASLRKRHLFAAIRCATIAVLECEGFRIVHFSIQRNHLHLIVEAESKQRLSRGMQGFLISAAKHINAALAAQGGKRRRGNVFADRYHSRSLTTPRAVRHAICYVLNNWRRHSEDRASFAARWTLDPYSNAADFPGWKELEGSPNLYTPPRTYYGLATWLPKTWLLRVGWSKHSAISAHEVPGPQP
jgi:REP element-mobilizing transposase RayT